MLLLVVVVLFACVRQRQQRIQATGQVGMRANASTAGFCFMHKACIQACCPVLILLCRAQHAPLATTHQTACSTANNTGASTLHSPGAALVLLRQPPCSRQDLAAPCRIYRRGCGLAHVPDSAQHSPVTRAAVGAAAVVSEAQRAFAAAVGAPTTTSGC